MSYVFEVKDKTGRKIHLSQTQWTHIREEHTQVIKSEDIEDTLKNPLKIVSHKHSGTVLDYYTYHKHRKQKSKYLKVIVKYLNGIGFVITAYFVRHIN